MASTAGAASQTTPAAHTAPGTAAPPLDGGLLALPEDGTLDRLTRLAARALGVPVAALGLLDRDGHAPASIAAPPELSSLRRSGFTRSLCRFVAASGEPLALADARDHPLAQGSPAVVDLGLVAYLGVPLTSAGGTVVGTLCAADVAPREWSAADVAVIRDVAEALVEQLELASAAASARLDGRRLAQAQALAGIGSWEWDVARGEVTWSERVFEIMGVEPAAGPLGHEQFLELVEPQDREAVAGVIAAALAGERQWYEYECRFRRPAGGRRTICVRADVEYGPDGAPLRSTGIVRDVTAEREAARDLADTARRLSEAQALGQMGSWEWHEGDGRLRWSHELYRMFGVDPGDSAPSQEELLARVHPGDRDRVARITREAHAGGAAGYALECRIVRADGELRWIRARGQIERDRDGRMRRSSGVAQDITEGRTVASRLAEAESLGRIGSWTWDVADDRATWSDQLYRIFELDPERFTPSRDSVVALAHPDDRERVNAALEAALAGVPLDVTARVPLPDGSVRWIRARGGAARDSAGALLRLTGTMQDVTEQRRVESLLHEAEGRFGTAFDATGWGMALLDLELRRFLRVNQVLCSELGRSERELLSTRPADLAVRGGARLDPQDIADLRAGRRQSVEFEGRFLRPGGDHRIALVHLAVVRDVEGEPLYHVAQVRDITDQRRAEEQVRYQALHHPLTGLPNRMLFVDRLRQALRHAERRASTVAVIAIDIDRFRTVNERFGLEGGDTLLRRLAPRLAESLRESDTVAHLGEDTFAVVCEDLSGEREALELAARLVRVVRQQPVAVDAQRVEVTASAGVVLAAAGGARAEDLVRDAESAVLWARDRGGDTCEVFDPALRARLMDRLEIEHDLRRGIERGELRVHYQPVVGADGRRLVGYEALVRWQHPERGLLMPGAFLPVAEETGLTVPLGSHVLREACRQAVAWSRGDSACEGVGVGVNVSAAQVDDPAFVAEVAEVLADTGLRPSRLRLELTESDLMRSADPAGTVAALKALGVRVILDDFGIGWSSLSHLRRFPVDGLKIDRSFVAEVDTDVQSARIVEAIVGMARALDLTVVAEGVETETQLRKLRALGCHMLQGFLLERPAPPADLRRDWTLPGL